MAERKAGLVYLVGAGPGDPGLLTLRARECLAEADVVLFDYLVDERVLHHCPPHAVRISIGKHGPPGRMTQEEVNRCLCDHAAAGKTVVRLKGGDPLLFGRVGEEAEALRAAGIPFHIVPGVTSALAAPGYAGIPVTHRDMASAVIIVTGREAEGRAAPPIPWHALAQPGMTVVFLMSARVLEGNLRCLMEAGLPPTTPAAVIRWATTVRQEVITGTVEELAERARMRRFEPPAIVVVGEAVQLRAALAWYERLPFYGRRILVTRARDQLAEFTRRLEILGAEVVEFPTIEIVPAGSAADLDRAAAEVDRYDWVAFTSANGVAFFFDRLAAQGGDARRLGRARLAAIGPQTAAALHARGLRADVVPGEYRAEALAAAFAAEPLGGKRVLLPRAAGARPVLPDTLRQLGAIVDEVEAYRAVRPEAVPDGVRERLARGEIDVVTFTSSSTVTNFAALLGAQELPELLGQARVACIGPVTAETARQLGLRVAVVASHYTVAGLTEAIRAALT